MKKRITTILTTGVLAVSLTVPAMAAEPQPFTIHQNSWSRADYSQQANPVVFTDAYDWALYNTLRQTLGDVDAQTDTPNDQLAYTMVGELQRGKEPAGTAGRPLLARTLCPAHSHQLLAVSELLCGVCRDAG